MRFRLVLLFLGVAFGLTPARADTLPLDVKLAHQFARYQAAQDRLLQRLAAQGTVGREEWEQWLAPAGDDVFTDADLAALRKAQRTRIEAARQRARAQSAIDLDALRHLPGDEASRGIADFCSKMPKGAMLHVHPSGTLLRATARRLLTAKDPVLPFGAMVADFETPAKHMLLYPEELQWLRGLGQERRFSALGADEQNRYIDFFVLPPGNHPFERFDAVFTFVDTATQDWNEYGEAIMDFARRAVAEGVVFVELRMGVNAASLPKIAAILERVEQETGLIVRIDRSFNRTATEAQREAALAELLSLPPSKWIVGIDLLGNERETPALATAQVVYGRVLQSVRDGKARLHRTMHAGELGDPRNPRDAMILGSERLGHGVLLAQDPVGLEYAVRLKEPIEVNLVSNVRLEAVADIAAHPFLDYLRLGLPVSLSTDDEGIFETDIDNECRVAITTSDVTYAELKQMAYNSLQTAFVEEAARRALLATLAERFAAFERSGVQGLSAAAPPHF